MPYRFTCRSCFEYIYLEALSKEVVDNECPHCQSSNFINEKWHKLENIDQTTFAKKPLRDKAEMPQIKNDKDLNQSSEPHSVTNLGIISLLIFFISFFFS